MSVPFYSFNDLDDNVFQEKVLGRFKEIVEAHAFVEGKYNAQFEKNFAEKQKAKHCLLVGNGTDALEIALQAYDVGPGDKVGVPGISFYASAEAIINCGAEVIFIDVDPKTGLMCPESLKRIIKEHKLKAILPVHIYGQPAPIAELEEICGPSDIKIVEDAAQAAGGYLSAGQPIGSSNNLTTFSFYPTKNLSACGDAGAVLTSDDELAEKIISIRNHGRSPNGHALIGRNSRCDHLQAAVLELKLQNIQKLYDSRRASATKYYELLSDLDLRIPPKEFLNLSSWHLFPVGVKSKEEKYALKDFLTERGIGSALFYEKAMPQEIPLENCAGEKENALKFAEETLCIPMNPFLTKEHITEVYDALKQFLSK